MASVAFLLGAGASVDAGLATSNRLVSEFITHVNGKSEQLSSFLTSLLEFALPWKKNLLFFKRQQLPWLDDAWLLSQIGIEERDLVPFNQGFKTQQAADAFNAWMDQNHPAQQYLNIEDLARLLFEFDEDEFIDNPMSILVEDRGRIFLRSHRKEVRDLQTELLTFIKWRLRQLINPSYLASLSAVANLLGAPQTLPVFTFNYDLAVETACANAGVTFTDGLPEGSMLSRLDFSAKAAQILLYKLHGSLNWFTFQADALLLRKQGMSSLPYEEYRDRFMGGPPTGVYTGSDWIVKDNTKLDQFYADGLIQAMVFGTEQKMQTAVPYFDLLRKFAEELSQVQVLVTVGYGFGDLYINRMIVSFFNGFTESRPFKLVVVGPDFKSGQEFRMARKLGLDPDPKSVV